jgi:hypothetical protein
MLRRRFVLLAIRHLGLGLAGCSLTGCGTLLHSERSGRPHSNQIDWRIAALDGLGLLLFFVPGVVAFAVDFYTGAIYLPLEEAYPDYGAPAGYIPPGPASPNPMMPGPTPGVPPGVGQAHPARLQQLGLKRVVVPREQLQPWRIQQIVAEHVGQEVSLDDRNTRVTCLASLEQFLDAIRPS